MKAMSKVKAGDTLFTVYCTMVIFAALMSTTTGPIRRISESPVKARTIAELKRPFFKFLEGGFDYVVAAPALEDIADSADNLERSPYIVYEDDRPLGPAHALHQDISKLGHGRFSHWTKLGFVISSSDGTNPDTNRRTYRVALPP